MNLDPSSDGTNPPSPRQSRSAPLIERAPLPMIEVEGREHVVCFVNAAFCRLVAKDRSELVGKSFVEIVSNGDRCVPLLDRIYQTGEFETHVEPDPSESNPAYWLYAMWPTLDAEKRPARVVIQLTKSAHFHQNVTAMNEALLIGGLRQHELREAAEQSNARLEIEITERKRIEQALREAKEKLRADADQLERTVAERTRQLRASVGELEAFSYSLVHDLRAPVRAIHGFTQLALEMSREEMGRSAVELLNRVVKAAVRMDSLIQDVLSLSEMIRQPIKIEPVDVEMLARSLIEERPELSLPQADIRIESPLRRVRGHEATFSQCLTNLLGNAVKFVEPGVIPHVRIWSELLPARPAGETAEVVLTPDAANPADQGMVRLWIEDNGIGIAAEAHETIFGIFQRLHGGTRYEGSGIGLAIVRKAIKRMGGRVGVESEPGQGSRFWLELPAA